MGGIWTSIQNVFSKPYKIIIIGDIYHLKPKVIDNVPALSFHVENFQYKKLSIVCGDFGLRQRMIPIYSDYLTKCSAMMLVLDARCDSNRYEQQIKFLRAFLDYEGVKGIKFPILFFTNKPATRTKNDIVKDFELSKLEGPWTIQQYNTIKQNEEELTQGLEWLSNQLQSRSYQK